MSIAITTRRTAAPSRRLRVQAVSAETPPRSQQEQLRYTRTLIRHFVLAFTASATAIYGVIASGLTM